MIASLVLAATAVQQTAQPATEATNPAPVETVAPAPESPEANPDAQPDVVITARRRSERLQDVPIAVSVIGGDRLEQSGSNNVAKLIQLQPSLTFYSTNPRNSAANIRGLGAPFGLTNDGIEQGVGVYVDQVYNSRIAAATFDFLDVDQV